VILAPRPPFVKQKRNLTTRGPAFSPYLGISLGIAAVSTAAIFITYAQRAGAPSLVIAAYRLTIASLVLLPLVVRRHRAEAALLTRRTLGLALISGLFLGLHFATWISSLAYTSVASSLVMVSTSPLFVALISALGLRERLSAAMVGGMLVALAGGVAVGLSDACTRAGCPPLAEFFQGQAVYGDLLAVVGAMGAAVYLVIGRNLRASMSLTLYIFLTYGTAAIVLCLAVVAAGLPVAGYAPRTYLWFGLLALVPQLIGHTSFNWALRYLPATYVSVTVLGEPLGSTVLAFLFLRQTPSLLKILGGVLILGGILFAARRAPQAA